MSRELNVTITMDELARKVGHLVVQMWQYEKKIAVLEDRVDELDPPVKEEPKDA